MSSIAKIIVALGFIVFVMALGYTVATSSGSEDFQRLSQDAAQLEAENATLAAENAQLRANIKALEKDPRIIERRIRDDFGMIRRDELVFILNQPEQAEN